DLQLGARPGGPRPDDLPLRPGHHRSRVGAELQVRHRPARFCGHTVRGRRGGRRLMSSRPATTPSQTVGPFFALPGGILWDAGPEAVPEGTAGAFVLRGRVLDGNGDPVPDAVVETWQADSQGLFDHENDPRGETSQWQGFGRC